jgi:hypothetical protein
MPPGLPEVLHPLASREFIIATYLVVRGGPMTVCATLNASGRHALADVLAFTTWREELGSVRRCDAGRLSRQSLNRRALRLRGKPGKPG